MDKKTASRAPNTCPPDSSIETLAMALYAEKAVRDGLVPPIRGKGRGRRPVDWRLAARVAATVIDVGLEKTGELLQAAHPGQPADLPHRDDDVSVEARRKRVRRLLARDEAHRADMLQPGAADEAYFAPEERLVRLNGLLEHYVTAAYEQWLRVEKTLND